MNDQYMSHEEFFREQYNIRTRMIGELDEVIEKMLQENWFDRVSQAKIMKQNIENEVEMLEKFLGDEIGWSELMEFYEEFMPDALQHLKEIVGE